MTKLEELLYSNTSTVIRRIGELAAHKEENEKITYWLQSPRSNSDPTEWQQAHVIRKLHEEGVVKIIKQHLDWISFQINKERFKKADNIYNNNSWAVQRAMGAFSLEKLQLDNPSAASIHSFSSITIKLPAPPKIKPLPPPLNWNDTSYNQRELPPTGMVVDDDGLSRTVYRGNTRIKFAKTGRGLRCAVLDYLYRAENRHEWCLASKVAEDIEAKSKEVRDAIVGINRRALKETGDPNFQIVAIRQRGEKINSQVECKWAV